MNTVQLVSHHDLIAMDHGNYVIVEKLFKLLQRSNLMIADMNNDNACEVDKS